ncbi:MAG: MBL fold metallo-hydrolase [Cognatishimia sp.]
MSRTAFITLGTAGGPVPKLKRGQPAHVVSRGDHHILVDCGEGAIGQLQRAGIDFRSVHDIFLSHHHFDHIGSLFACLGTHMMTQRKEPLNIYGPVGTDRIIQALSTACDVPWEIGLGSSGKNGVHPRDFVHVHEINPGDVVQVGDIRVSCCENTHYRAEAEFGQAGAVSLSFRFDAPDRSMVFTGDTGPCEALEKMAKGAQLLVGELMDSEQMMARVRRQNPQMPAERIAGLSKHMAQHHLVAKELGNLAARAGVQEVVAVHISLDSINAETAPTYVAQIAEAFAGKITIAEDFDRF